MNRKLYVRKACLTLTCFMILTLSSIYGLEKYEPADGSIYYGYCASGYWSDEGLDNRVNEIYNDVSNKKFLLYSFFVHAKEHGQWNGWEWKAEGPNGQPIHGSGDHIKRVRDKGFVPVIAWTWMDWADHSKSPTIKGLLRGEYDWYLDEWIKGIKEFGTPIFIRLSHEMDGYWYPYSEGYINDPDRNTAEDYVAYWRYVVDRFNAAGVNNVAWVWCVSGGRSGVRDWIDYYPGDAYVDWIAADIYSNRNGADTLKELCEAIDTDKPIMVPEGGTEDLLTAYNWQYQGNSQWIKDFFDTALYETNSRVKAVCWFHWNEHSFLQRDAEQVKTYRNYINRSAFINVLSDNGNTSPEDNSSDTLKPQISVGSDLTFSGVGDTKHVETKFYNFNGSTGSKWSVLSGDSSGLEIDFNGPTAKIIARKAGTYKIKVEAWDSHSHYASNYINANVLSGTAPTPDDGGNNNGFPETPSISVPSNLSLEANKYPVFLQAKLEGFEGRTGCKWSVEKGNANGLKIECTENKATITPFLAGEYLVKVQVWDSDDFASSYIKVTVGDVESAPVPDNNDTRIVVPNDVTLVAGSDPKTIEADIVGLSDNFGGKWSLDQGDPNGIVLVDNLTSATVKALLPGEYRIKVQAWSGGKHVSAYIQLIATNSTAVDTAKPSIIAPDWVQMDGNGVEYELEAAIVGFTAKGYKWSVEAGKSGGLSIKNEGLKLLLKGYYKGDYTVKIQAWNGSIYTSKHIRISVL